MTDREMLDGVERVRHEMAARCDALERLMTSMLEKMDAIVVENRSLLADIERRQHVAASAADELKGKFRDVEARELDIQRTLAVTPDVFREIVADEINRMDGYTRYALERLLKELREAARE